MTRQTRHNRKKRAMLVGLKQFKGCECCGWKPANAKLLHFHHTDPATKLFNISQSIHSKSWPQILAEVEKCQILCEPCHIHLEGVHDGFRTRRVA
jgi:hypothetical protein